MSRLDLIADSGSTKTDWSIVREGSFVRSFQTKGMNPYFQSRDEICGEIKMSLLPQLGSELADISATHFYGAGCVFDKAELMRDLLQSYISSGFVEVYSDLLAAAHGLCGHEAGIACIIGTGSNSCFYDGNKIVKNVPPLGFILGDEGSGAALGRILVSDVLKGILSKPLRDAFFEHFHLTQADVLDRVYKQSFPNRFLASLSPFLHEHIDNEEIRELVLDSFKTFLTRNVKHYDYQTYKVNFVGSVAYYYKDILFEAADCTGMKIGKIVQSPMDGLIEYYRV